MTTSRRPTRLWKTAGVVLSVAVGFVVARLTSRSSTGSSGAAERLPMTMEPELSTTVDESEALQERRHSRSLRRLTVALGVAVALVLGIGVGSAYAFYKSTGAGNGHAATGTLQPVTVTAVTGTPGTPLYPGGTGDVIVKVTNPNSFAVTLVSVTGNGTITAVGGIGTCTTTGVTFTDQSSLSDSVAASTTTQIDFSAAASMSSSSQTGCQGATFSIPVTITVHA